MIVEKSPNVAFVDTTEVVLSGIVDEDVEAAEALDGGRDDLPAPVCVREVGDPGERPVRPDLGGDPIKALTVHVGEDEARPLLAEAACGGLADAGRGTRDQDDLVRKT